MIPIIIIVLWRCDTCIAIFHDYTRTDSPSESGGQLPGQLELTVDLANILVDFDDRRKKKQI